MKKTNAARILDNLDVLHTLRRYEGDSTLRAIRAVIAGLYAVLYEEAPHP